MDEVKVRISGTITSRYDGVVKMTRDRYDKLRLDGEDEEIMEKLHMTRDWLCCEDYYCEEIEEVEGGSHG